MNTEASVKLFKALSDASRLHIVKSLMNGEMYTELLAERLNLSPSTVSFHMKKLEDAGIVSARKEQYYTVYSLNKSLLDSSLVSLLNSTAEDAVQNRREAEYEKKVLEAFFEYGKLKSIPVQRKKKLICLQEIAKSFEIGRVYQEKELSDIIAVFHEDYCTLRRDMISEGILKRHGTEYTRIK